MPDIPSTVTNCTVLNDPFKSAASTPNKSTKSTNTSTPTKIKKKNISIIFEDREKENPNYAFNLKAEKCLSNETLNNTKQRASEKTIKNVEYKEMGIQCNKMDEDLLLSDNVEKTNYWKLLAHKRYKCLIESLNENSEENIFWN